MNWRKRGFDIVFASLLVLVLGPILIGLVVYLLLREGRPLFYVADRMKTPDQAFRLWKLRSMTIADHDQGVSGGDKACRVTRTGKWLRRTRLDELPQLWNILRGDMSFVGPRPPLREYVERFPDVYSAVLKSRPGVTGLATIKLHQFEERMLGKSRSADETDDIYCRACVPRKAMLDLIYQRNQSLSFDINLVFQTTALVFGRQRTGPILSKAINSLRQQQRFTPRQSIR